MEEMRAVDPAVEAWGQEAPYLSIKEMSPYKMFLFNPIERREAIAELLSDLVMQAGVGADLEETEALLDLALLLREEEVVEALQEMEEMEKVETAKEEEEEEDAAVQEEMDNLEEEEAAVLL
jgi:hypothetical protein